ncbi:hypothetical protein SteCoe_13870 [Stentor coeruleus]|uniref:Uncharacterized protein n=1 Tax=Stentor coeruleus TaxID=5963 RepID=A0A1R2C7I6_9CILI|nr:hypothetical protein SteCoe_13870 [Stentor coeruleus]
MSFKYRNDFKFSESRELDQNKNPSIPVRPEVSYEEFKVQKEDLNYNTFEIQELRSEILALKQIIETKDIALLKVKEDLKNSTIANNKAVGEKRFLQEEILALQKEQEKILSEYEVILSKFESASSERTEKCKYIDFLENKVKILESENTELKSQSLQVELELQNLRNRDQDTQHEIKVFENQINSFQENEETYLTENRELKKHNDECAGKIVALAREIEELHRFLQAKDNSCKLMQQELKEYQDLLGNLKENEENLRRTAQEKDRAMQKIKDLLISIEEQDRKIEEKDKLLQSLQETIKRLTATCGTLQKDIENSLRNEERYKNRLREYEEKIELLLLREKEVQDYVLRKKERLKARNEAEIQLMTMLRSI